MRMLAVLNVHLSERDGGAERQTAALLAGMTKLGHRVLGIVKHGSPAERRALDEGAPVFPVGPRFPLGPGGVLTWWSRGRVRLLVRRGGWDLIHFHDPESWAGAAGIVAAAMAAGSLPSTRVLVTYRGQRAAASGRAPAPLRRHHRAGGTIVAASEALWAALVREGYDEDLLCFIHPGVEMKRFSSDAARRAAARREIGCDEGSVLVGMVAVLDRDRGATRFLEAAAILLRERDPARFVIVGDGARRGSLEAKAARLGIAERVRFTGWREDVQKVLPALDAFVFPGEGEEIFPASLVEAMAASIPVVVCDQPGIREIIENGKQGLIVPGKGSESLARTIHRVLADREVATKMGRAGAVRVQRFHTQAMVDAHEALYYRVSKIARES